MRYGLIKLATASALIMLTCGVAQSQSAAEIIEKARLEAGQFNEYKAALEDPDQSVRLAVFEAMLQQKQPALRMIAIQTGLSSIDHVMRSRALAAQIMSMDQLPIKLEVDPKASDITQKQTTTDLENLGKQIILQLNEKNNQTNGFNWNATGHRGEGQVNNTQVVLTAGRLSITLTLQDDNTLKGSYVHVLSSDKTTKASATVALF